MSGSSHARFLALHTATRPLLLPNAWDAASARLWQHAGATAVATSSAAMAWSRGYADGGALPRADLLDALRGIVRVTAVPVSADIEHGYSDDPQAVAALVVEVVDTGAIGINLEDGGGPPALLAAKIAAIRAALGAAPCFINARTDVYLRALASGEAAVAMSIARLAQYRDAGADGGFVPGLTSADDAATIARAVPLAINVMAMPGLARVDALAAAGVQRISSGPQLFKAAFGTALAATQAYLRGDFAPALASTLDFGRINALFADPEPGCDRSAKDAAD
ncbi:MAG: isocitrate lyase/PEP mutase family protein [Luteimonas sp.]